MIYSGRTPYGTNQIQSSSLAITVENTDVAVFTTGSLLVSGSLTSLGGFTGSFSGSFTGSANLTTLTSSNALITGNVTVLGTASINTLVINQTQLSTGSNQLGDNVDDFQTLFGTVRIPTGSLTVTGSSFMTGSLTVTSGITGSLFGTSSLALSASYVNPLTQSVFITGSLIITGSTTITGTQVASSGIGRTMLITSSISASTNNDTLVSLDINSTFNTGSFTGVSNASLRITRNTNSASIGFGIIDATNTVFDITYPINGGLRFGPSGSDGAMFQGYGATNSLFAGQMYFDYGSIVRNVSGRKAIWRSCTTGAATDVMTLFSTGNMLLQNGGTHSDSGFKLDVSGSGRFSGNLTVTGSATNSLLVKGSGATSSTTSLRVENSAATARLTILDDGTSAFNTNNLYISSSGNIGIGTSSPTSRLFVNGNTYLSGSAGTGSALTVYKSGSTVVSIQGSQGELFSITDSLSGSLFSVSNISGLPILEVFSDNTTLIGNYLDPMLVTTQLVTANSGSTTIYSLPTASYDGAFYDYVVRSGSNSRAGQIMAIWSGSSVNYTDNSTTDFGSTANLSFNVIVSGSNMVLRSTVTTGSWTVKTIIRSI